MKNTIIALSLVSLFLFNLTRTHAQDVPDSTMQKIKSFRSFYETLGKAYPIDSSVTEDVTEIDGIKSYWFNQKLLSKKSFVIYLHGGVYTYGNINAYRAMISHLAKSLDLPILYVEYSLSPEHPYPTANIEVLKVYTELRKKYPKSKITIIGDSAGGGLAITLVSTVQKSKLPVPDAVVLISPWINLKCDNNSYIAKQSVDPILSKDFLYNHALMYAGKKIKEADPSELKFEEFPPVLLLVGSDEVLNDDTKNFYAVIRPIQPKAEMREFKGQKHVWVFSQINTPASKDAIADLKRFIATNVK